MAKKALNSKSNQISYILFGKPVSQNSLLHTLCDTYYGDYLKLEKDLSESTNNTSRCIMLDIREAFWCNEFRTEDLDMRRKVLFENYYSTVNEPMPL